MRLIDADALKKRMVNEPVKAVQDVDFQAEWFTRIADTVCHMIDMVDEAPTVAAPRWVRCEERMPETMVRCLIWDGYEADTAYLIRGFHDCKSDWYWRKVGIRRSGGKIPFRVIKMWMPIEPPKEDA